MNIAYYKTMSITSGRRKTIQLSTDLSEKLLKSADTPSKKAISFKLPHNSRLKEILNKFLHGENIREYEQLVCAVRDNLLDDNEIMSLLEEASECISRLGQKLRLFVEAILSIDWGNKSKNIINKYRSFLVNLLCAHNYHVKFAVDKLVSNFVKESETEWLNGVIPEVECIKYANIHSVLKVLLDVLPMSREILLQSLISHYPYMKKSPHIHEAYVHNILWILDYQSEFRLEILCLLFNKLIILDVHTPKKEITQEEIDNEEDIFEFDDGKFRAEQKSQPLVQALDLCLDKILNYFISDCYDLETGDLNWDKTKKLYQTMLVVFDKIILPTYNVRNVQFTLFFLCSLKITLAEGFLSYLWRKVCDPNVPSIHRQSAVGYVASLLARATFIPLSTLKTTMEQMATWIHKYISNQDGLECINSDVRVHSVFYSVCQSLFYLVAFRQRELINTKKNIAFLESLNLSKIVTCRLNPLRVCQPAILQNFAAVTRTYQLAYCYSIIEHNQRNVMPTVYFDEKGAIVTKSSILDAFFPFDPLILEKCGEKIAHIYLNYKESEENVEEEIKMEEDDDFLSGNQMSTKLQTNRFSYGTSPGFKCKT